MHPTLPSQSKHFAVILHVDWHRIIADIMDFSSAPAAGKMDAGQRERLMDQVKQQIALANAQELLEVRSQT